MNVDFQMTPIGEMGVGEEGGRIVRLFFVFEKKKWLDSISETDSVQIKRTAILNRAAQQLEEYFQGKRRHFDLPLAPHGTDFQRSVWNALLTVEYGTTATYQEIAEKIDNKNAARAVGGACHCNPIALVVPCHRIIGTNRKLTGFAAGLDKKQWLLQLEQKHRLTKIPIEK